MKSAAANVGGDRLRELALVMERAADNGDLVAVRNSMAQLEARFQELKDEIMKTWVVPREMNHPAEGSFAPS